MIYIFSVMMVLIGVFFITEIMDVFKDKKRREVTP